MKILKSMGIIVLVVTGVSLGLGSVSALAAEPWETDYDFEITHIITGINEDGGENRIEIVHTQRAKVKEQVEKIPQFSGFYSPGFIVGKAHLATKKISRRYEGGRVPATVMLMFVDTKDKVINEREAQGALTLGGKVNLLPPSGYKLVHSEDVSRIVLAKHEEWHISVQSVSGSGTSADGNNSNQLAKPDSKPNLDANSKPDLPQPQPDKINPAPSTKPQPVDPTPEIPKPQPVPNPAKPQPSKPTAPTLPTSPTPQPQPATLPTQPVVLHPALPANPTHHSLTTNLPAATKPRPWAHHSAVDLWEAAPDTAADTATTPSQATDHPHTSPVTSNHHQAAHAANQPSAASAPAKSPAKTPSAAKRLPQTNDRPNGLAIAIGSLLLSFTGIWRNRRIHQ
ncbi:hypothetical protein [Levilactobacillus angrenensis]|uniref:LPXTG cell wall anchor domain-containing protein n=1 Tax=Levilactobacillus angrenensis TaxID=2486020 RepID=A0ABW1U9J2_9LACO|nr:hypothetical protein [Levilactobacillus angrenensis]